MLKSMVGDLPLSQFLVDKQFRLFNKIRSRINNLEFQKNYALTSNRVRVEYTFNLNRDLDVLNWLSARLVYNSLFCNTEYLEVLQMFNQFPKKTKDHSEKVLGFYIPRKLNLYRGIYQLENNLKSALPSQVDMIKRLIDDEYVNIALIEKSMEQMKKFCLKSRKNEKLSRLILESRLRVRDGWFIVFNTLTSGLHNESEVFGEGSTAWTDYVRTVDRAVGISIFGSWRKAIAARKRGEEFHRYFAVLERGSITGKPHFHVLHFMKGLPNGCCDPNVGRSIHNYREVSAFKKLWRHGFSTPKAVRINMSDAYAKQGWLWPHVKSDDKSSDKWLSLECKPPEAVAFYVAGYLTKEYGNTQKRKGLPWRTKMSQSLGKEVPQMIVDKCSKNQLELILRMRSRNVLQIKNQFLPLWLMKKLAMEKLLKKNQIRTPRSYWKFLLALKPREGFLKRLMSMILRKENLKLASIGFSRIMNLMLRVGSSLVKLVKKVSIQEFGLDIPKINMCGSTTEVRCG